MMVLKLNPGYSLGYFLLGQSLYTVLTFLKSSPFFPSHHGLSDGHCSVEVNAPKTSSEGIIVTAQAKIGLYFTIVFDALHQVAVSVAVSINHRVTTAESRLGDSPRMALSLQRTDDDLLEVALCEKSKDHRISSILQQSGMSMSNFRTVKLENSQNLLILGNCNGSVLTFLRKEDTYSEIVAPFPPIASFEDALNARCVLVEVQAVPLPSTPLYLLLVGTVEESSHMFTVPTVHVIVDAGTRKATGIGIQWPQKDRAHCKRVLFNDSIQGVLTQLGAPDDIYYRAFDNADVFYPVSRAKGMHQHQYRVDLFFNYSHLGLDVLFDSDTLRVRKFILHASPPRSGEFGSYSRCHFRIAYFEGILATGEKASFMLDPLQSWSKVERYFGLNCRLIKEVHRRDLEYLGHSHTKSTWYSLGRQFFVEVLLNNEISSICFIADVAATESIPPQVSHQQVDGRTLKSPTPTSSISSEGFEDAESQFGTPLGSLRPQSYQISAKQEIEYNNVNLLTDPPKLPECSGEHEDELESDTPIVAPCFSEPEDDEESEEQEQDESVSLNRGDTNAMLSVSSQLPSPLCHPLSTSGMDSSQITEDSQLDREHSITSSYDIVLSVVNQQESQGQESPIGHQPDSTEPELDEEEQLRYRPGGQQTTSRLSELIASTSHKPKTAVRNSTSGLERKPLEVFHAHKGHKDAKNKYRLSQKEEERLQRLAKPTFSFAQHYKEPVPVTVEASDSSEGGDPEDHGGDVHPAVGHLQRFIQEDSEDDKSANNTSDHEGGVCSKPQEQEVPSDSESSTSERIPTVHQSCMTDNEVSSHVTNTEHTQEVHAISSTKQEGSCSPKLSLGSFQNTLLQQFGIPLSTDDPGPLSTSGDQQADQDSTTEHSPGYHLKPREDNPISSTEMPLKEELNIGTGETATSDDQNLDTTCREPSESVLVAGMDALCMDKWRAVKSTSSNEVFRDTEVPMISLVSALCMPCLHHYGFYFVYSSCLCCVYPSSIHSPVTIHAIYTVCTPL